MRIKKYLNRLVSLYLVSGAASFASESVATKSRLRCLKLVATEGTNKSAEWNYALPKAYGLLDVLSGIAKANRDLTQFIFSKKRLPAKEELQQIIFKEVDKRFHAILRNPHQFSEEKTKELKEEFVAGYSAELWEFLLGSIQLVAVHDQAGKLLIPGLYSDYSSLVEKLRQSDPTGFAAFENAIASQALLWFSMKLVPPTVRQLAAAIGFDSETGLQLLFAVTSRAEMWQAAMNSDNGIANLMRAEGRILQAYARAVRGTDTPLTLRTRRIAPTTRRMVEVLGLTRENTWYRTRLFSGLNRQFDMQTLEGREATLDVLEKQLAHLIGDLDQKGAAFDINQDPIHNDPEWIFAMPRLFRGRSDLHQAAKSNFRSTFNSFVDTQVFNTELADRLIEKIENSKGMLISSYTPGREINWALVESMIRMAKDQGKIVVLINETGLLEGTDPLILNHPDLNILPATIANRALKLWMHPNSGRQNAFAGLKNLEHYNHGSTVIVPHHTLDHELRPSGINHLGPTKLYSTGSINTKAVGGVGAAQAAKAEKISNAIKQGFLVVEKVNNIDSDLPIQNRWHVRPIEWRKQTDFFEAGITDKGVKYKVWLDSDGKMQWSTERNGPRVFYLPDVHFISANPEAMRALVDYMKSQVEESEEVLFLLPDPIDSKAINHHVEKTQGDVRLLHKMLMDGTLDFNEEMNQAIANVNQLLSLFPKGRVMFQYSNHSDEWIKRNLLDQPSLLQSVVNGPIIREMGAALDANPGMTPLEYLLLEREATNIGLDRRNTKKHYEDNTYISDVRRVRTLRAGDSLPGNRDPLYRAFLQNHGNRGSNGAKGSPGAHKEGMHRQVTADAHTSGYTAKGDNFWIGVGATSLQQPYTRQGGYSSWGISMAQISNDGTMTLLYLDLNTGTFVQDAEGPLLGPKQFFADQPLKPEGPIDDDSLRRERDQALFQEFLDEGVPRYQEGILEP